jgi:inositol phosphorylceramide synthase catalytic subunit
MDIPSLLLLQPVSRDVPAARQFRGQLTLRSFIPVEIRPPIWVRVLPALENILFSTNLSAIVSAHTHPLLDLLAWLPYGVGHFAAPALTAAALFLFASPGTTPVFARAFGYLALAGVTTQLLLPCTPPWYETEQGLDTPAQYGMPGSPAGLARVDALLGVDMYTTSFTTAPLPFGAFPSLHAADATLEAIVLARCFPRLRIPAVLYVVWIFWATLYLGHHYAVDLVGGVVFALVTYAVARRFLPRRQQGKRNRWDYDFVDFGRRGDGADEERGWAPDEEGEGLPLAGLRRGSTADSDDWSIGSSSSASGSSSNRSSLTVTLGREYRPAAVTMLGEVWDGQPVERESELSDVLVMR